MIDLKGALTIFIGTLPLLIALILNLLDIKQIRAELVEIRKDISNIKERLATLEERERVKLS